MTERFPADVQAALAEVEEIEIETSLHEQAPRHRTIIWPVVDDQGRVLVRSWRGAGGRWFRETLVNPAVTIVLDDREIPATALLANDEDRVTAASHGYRSKYARSGSLESMLEEAVLATTLELVPR